VRSRVLLPEIILQLVVTHSQLEVPAKKVLAQQSVLHHFRRGPQQLISPRKCVHLLAVQFEPSPVVNSRLSEHVPFAVDVPVLAMTQNPAVWKHKLVQVVQGCLEKFPLSDGLGCALGLLLTLLIGAVLPLLLFLDGLILHQLKVPSFALPVQGLVVVVFVIFRHVVHVHFCVASV
jgi:hypothetical protein